MTTRPYNEIPKEYPEEYTLEDWARIESTLRLLPPGYFLRPEWGSNLHRFMSVIADEFAEVEDYFSRILDESDIGTAEYFLDEWEERYDLPIPFRPNSTAYKTMYPSQMVMEPHRHRVTVNRVLHTDLISYNDAITEPDGLKPLTTPLPVLAPSVSDGDHVAGLSVQQHTHEVRPIVGDQTTTSSTEGSHTHIIHLLNESSVLVSTLSEFEILDPNWNSLRRSQLELWHGLQSVTDDSAWNAVTRFKEVFDFYGYDVSVEFPTPFTTESLTESFMYSTSALFSVRIWLNAVPDEGLSAAAYFSSDEVRAVEHDALNKIARRLVPAHQSIVIDLRDFTLAVKFTELVNSIRFTPPGDPYDVMSFTLPTLPPTTADGITLTAIHLFVSGMAQVPMATEPELLYIDQFVDNGTTVTLPRPFNLQQTNSADLAVSIVPFYTYNANDYIEGPLVRVSDWKQIFGVS